MKFGEVFVQEASGSILAHSIVVNGQRMAKGTQLTEAHVETLQDAGIAEVIVARLGPEDIEENRAAQALAEALVPDPEEQGLRMSRASTGRVNVYATLPGVATIDARAIDAVNSVHPMITVATVPDLMRVDPDGMVATIKIIAYGVPEEALTASCAGAGGALRIQPAQLKTATLIETRISQTPPDKGRAAMAGRLERMGVSLSPRLVVAHEQGAITDALVSVDSDLVMILTASATSDPMDVAPSALLQAGGHVERFGMPVDPGNLLFIGQLGDKQVIGLPGCARSPALNGADWVLERIICGLSVTARDIAGMGVGGLLKEIPTRPKPRREAEG